MKVKIHGLDSKTHKFTYNYFNTLWREDRNGNLVKASNTRVNNKTEIVLELIAESSDELEYINYVFSIGGLYASGYGSSSETKWNTSDKAIRLIPIPDKIPIIVKHNRKKRLKRLKK